MQLKISTIQAIHELKRLVFTTRDVAGLTGASMASTVQCLKRLEEKGIIKGIMRAVWGMTKDAHFSPYLLIPYLKEQHRQYLSFISALNIYGVIGQIPQVVTVASTSHSKVVQTPVGTFEIHQIAPDFFSGFEWHPSHGYLIALPEKALVDCFYLASRKKKQFANFPELDLSLLKKSKCLKWAEKIKDLRIRRYVVRKIEAVFS